MSKSTKNLVREILIAQGFTGVEPIPEAVKALDKILDEKYNQGAVEYSMDLEG